MEEAVSKIRKQYSSRQDEIEEKLEDFRNLRDSSPERKFKELCFVLFTPQSDPENCWQACNRLSSHGLLKDPEKSKVSHILERHEVSFPRRKAEYLTENRKALIQPTLADPTGSLKIDDRIDTEHLNRTRRELAGELDGIGFKGSSHFLRNIGFGDRFAILSRPVLATLYDLNVLEKTDPPSDESEYLEMESKIQDLADAAGIDVQAIDLVLWSLENDKIFK